MPRKTKPSKKKATRRLRGSCIQKITAIAESTEKDAYKGLIQDFDIQADKLTRQTLRLFASEVKKLTQFLPQKTSIPKEILKMSAYEFKHRGGTLGAVLESWKTDKQLQPVSHFRSKLSATVPLNPVINKENEAESVATTDPSVKVDPDFVTPAFNTRSKARRKNDLKSTATGMKRKPNPLEHIELHACATNTGSPVDEEAFMSVQFSSVLEDMESQLLQSTSSFPQKWRSQLQKTIKCARLQVKSQMQDNYFQTPALRH